MNLHPVVLVDHEVRDQGMWGSYDREVPTGGLWGPGDRRYLGDDPKEKICDRLFFTPVQQRGVIALVGEAEDLKGSDQG